MVYRIARRAVCALNGLQSASAAQGMTAPPPAADQFGNPDSPITKENALPLFGLHDCECMHDPEIGGCWLADLFHSCRFPRCLDAHFFAHPR